MGPLLPLKSNQPEWRNKVHTLGLSLPDRGANHHSEPTGFARSGASLCLPWALGDHIWAGSVSAALPRPCILAQAVDAALKKDGEKDGTRGFWENSGRE